MRRPDLEVHEAFSPICLRDGPAHFLTVWWSVLILAFLSTGAIARGLGPREPTGADHRLPRAGCRAASGRGRGSLWARIKPARRRTHTHHAKCTQGVGVTHACAGTCDRHTPELQTARRRATANPRAQRRTRPDARPVVTARLCPTCLLAFGGNNFQLYCLQFPLNTQQCSLPT